MGTTEEPAYKQTKVLVTKTLSILLTVIIIFWLVSLIEEIASL